MQTRYSISHQDWRSNGQTDPHLSENILPGLVVDLVLLDDHLGEQEIRVELDLEEQRRVHVRLLRNAIVTTDYGRR